MIRLQLLARMDCALRAHALASRFRAGRRLGAACAIALACNLPCGRAAADAWPAGAWVISPGSFRLAEVDCSSVMLAGPLLQPTAPDTSALSEVYRELSTGTDPRSQLVAWSLAAARRGIVGTLKIRF